MDNWSINKPWALTADDGFGNRTIVARESNKEELEMLKSITDSARMPKIEYLKGTGAEIK